MVKVSHSKRRKPDYDLKAKVIDNGCVTFQRKFSLASWKYYQALIELELNGDITDLDARAITLERFRNELDQFSFEEIQEAIRVNNASYHRVKRLSDKVLTMLNQENCIFLTLTFRDDVLANTSEETRRRYIARFLKEQCQCYVANIDFGKQNEREHYHAVVVPKNDKIDGAFYLEHYGNIDFERVRNRKNENDYQATSKRLAKYVAKLVNHAIKETVRQNRVIYSRN